MTKFVQHQECAKISVHGTKCVKQNVMQIHLTLKQHEVWYQGVVKFERRVPD